PGRPKSAGPRPRRLAGDPVAEWPSSPVVDEPVETLFFGRTEKYSPPVRDGKGFATAPVPSPSSKADSPWPRFVMALLLAAAVVAGLFFAVRGLISSAPPTTATPSANATPCPGRIAAQLPQGAAELVAAYHTANKEIILCGVAGGVYYYGRYTDRQANPILLPATATASGYVARNGAYQYEIRGDQVVVSVNGAVKSQEPLTRDEAPS
ncbi:MAG TPA: hypothetical protein VFG15_00795, partial [Amycolatopsis sp.]|nr:hypothetical protein [Amycolatopsis sp.]